MRDMAHKLTGPAFAPRRGIKSFEEAGRVVREHDREAEFACCAERPHPMDMDEIDQIAGDGPTKPPLQHDLIYRLGFDERRPQHREWIVGFGRNRPTKALRMDNAHAVDLRGEASGKLHHVAANSPDVRRKFAG